MTPDTGIHLHDYHGVPVAAMEGEIDIANAAEMRERLFIILADRPPGLILDLSRVSYIDSRGVHILLELAERMKIRHQALRLVVPETAMIRRILQLTHLETIVPLDRTVEESGAQIGAR